MARHLTALKTYLLLFCSSLLLSHAGGIGVCSNEEVLYTVRSPRTVVYANETPIGYLYRGAKVIRIEETDTHIKVKAAGKDVEFYGWVKKEDLQQNTAVLKRLSKQETANRLDALLQVPYKNEREIAYKNDSRITGSGVRHTKKKFEYTIKRPVLNGEDPDGYGTIELLAQWNDDTRVTTLIGKRIEEFEALKKTGDAGFTTLVQDYIEILTRIKRGTKNIAHLLRSTDRKRKFLDQS